MLCSKLQLLYTENHSSCRAPITQIPLPESLTGGSDKLAEWLVPGIRSYGWKRRRRLSLKFRVLKNNMPKRPQCEFTGSYSVSPAGWTSRFMERDVWLPMAQWSHWWNQISRGEIIETEWIDLWVEKAWTCAGWGSNPDPPTGASPEVLLTRSKNLSLSHLLLRWRPETVQRGHRSYPF